MIEVEGVGKVYGRGRRALRDVTLRCGPGVFGLLGPNGAGKTTLMRIVATLLPPTTGTVRVGGFDVWRQPFEVRRLIGYLPQEYGIYRRLTAPEFLEYMAALKGISGRRAREEVERVLAAVHLDVGGQRVGTFSGGMKQRLGIAQALLGDPQVLIVDEPSAGLDPGERMSFRNMLAEISGRRTVILSTHIVADVEEGASEMAVLGEGAVVYRGTPAALCARARGCAWELDIAEEELSQARASFRIVRLERVGREIRLRVCSADNPWGRGRQVDPTLEDAYMWLMSVGAEGGAAGGRKRA